MSAYEEAKSAANRAAHDWDSDQWAHNYGSGSDVGDIVDIALDVFLAALSPSIVVDGKVIGLDKVTWQIGAEQVEGSLPLVASVAEGYFDMIVDAAREVAE